MIKAVNGAVVVDPGFAFALGTAPRAHPPKHAESHSNDQFIWN